VNFERAYFYACSVLAIAGASGVVVAKNPIRGAMGLLLLIVSVAALFLELHAEFLAAIQLIVYAGAIVILFLFVIMLLGPSASTPTDRRGLFGRALGAGLFAALGAGAMALVSHAYALSHATLAMPPADTTLGSIDSFGAVLFSDALVPFELSSALLMVAVVGAVAIARGRQGVRSLSKAELQTVLPSLAVEAPGSGVFGHAIDASVTTDLPGSRARTEGAR
jgi:NADH-quinone oxidoreductase subunit J